MSLALDKRGRSTEEPYRPARPQLTGIGNFPRNLDNPFNCRVCQQDKVGIRGQRICNSQACRKEWKRRLSAKSEARRKARG